MNKRYRLCDVEEAVSEMASLIIKVVIGDNANKNIVTMQSQ